MIWNFAPVGVGLQFHDDPENNISAEWEMDYRLRDHLVLTPKFTGKKKGSWSPLFGHELQLSYRYHYQPDPQPSYWDIVLRGSVILALRISLNRFHGALPASMSSVMAPPVFARAWSEENDG